MNNNMQDKNQIISISIVAVITIAIISAFVFFNQSTGGGNGGGILATSTVISNSTSTATTTLDLKRHEGQMTLEEISNLTSCLFTGDKDALAKCITEKGWAMYGTYSCSHCQAQKKIFGDSFQYIKYVECTKDVQLCIDKKINGFPTWAAD